MKSMKQVLSLAMVLLLCGTSINFSLTASAEENDIAEMAEINQTDESDESVENETLEVVESLDDEALPDIPKTTEEAVEETDESEAADVAENGERAEVGETSVSDTILVEEASVEKVDGEELSEGTDLKVAFDQEAEVDGVCISVKADEGVFPEGATLSVAKVYGSDLQAVEAAVEEERADDKNKVESYTFDIKVLDVDGNEIEPDNSQGQVRVSFTLAEVANANLETDVYHVKGEVGDLSVDKLEATETSTTVEAVTDGFSFYTVEFTYNNLQYVINGDTTVALAEILNHVGLRGTVSNAVSDAPKLFSVENTDSGWMVTANQAFTTEQRLTVTIDGRDYVIVVTDDVSSVSYIDHTVSEGTATAETKKCDNYITVASNTTSWEDNVWYVLKDPAVEIEDRITVNGSANLILCDGAALTAKKGITVEENNTLNIYAQSEGTGELIATITYGGYGTLSGAAIGGYQKAWNNFEGVNGGTVNIHGGNVIARTYNSSNGAGIGGYGIEGNGGRVTIYDGTVTANGTQQGAGIGGGGCTSDGPVNGGAGGVVTIYGGTVNATSELGGAGIGGGFGNHMGGDGGTIIIYGGNVTASSESGGAGIGGGRGAWKGGNGGTVTIYGGSVTATGELGSAGIGGGYSASDVSGSGYGGEGGTVTIYGGNVTATAANGAGIGSGNYGNGGKVEISGGTVTATGEFSGAGIGGGSEGRYIGTVTISGGTVIANGGRFGAGIGGGENSSGYNVIVTGGTVTAIGGSGGGMGIGNGGGNQSYDANLTIGSGLYLYGDRSSATTFRAYGNDEKYSGDRYKVMKINDIAPPTEQETDVPDESKGDVKAAPISIPSDMETAVIPEKPTVNGLNDKASELAKENGKDVTLNLVVTPKGQSKATQSEVLKQNEDIHTNVKDQFKDEESVLVDVLDISIEQFINGAPAANLSEPGVVVEIGISYNFEGKYDPTIVRKHNGSSSIFNEYSSRPSSGYQDASFFIDRANSMLYIYSDKFSDYVIAYSTEEGNAQNRTSVATGGSETASTISYPKTVPVYRLFNANSGQHFYTANKEEHDILVTKGWNDEGIAWQVRAAASIPVYRLFDKSKTGSHLFTSDAATRDSYIAKGWADEGIAWYAEAANGRVVYKFTKDAYELLTTSAAEKDVLAAAGFIIAEADFKVN
ncbi:hypothetical protein [Pseudobutyrivibrio sp.]|uniref:hypothetical protein n=1 Tax=Pseudobutyrivibrio sp. TaxID=2014367 RepID=UPI001B4E0720|nr:hypothetical protein [Pseudobutyrivibrio sp.]MBP3260758.1 hypothetical protein [Pseudobutyrivibrio sp.]